MGFPVAVLVGCGIVFFLWKSRRNYMRLPEMPVADGAPPREVSVIIPARNEAANIERVIRSFPVSTVIVVDDASDDRTAETARCAGAQVIAAPPLTPGVKGKPNACAAGARQATTPWLLFVDADTWFDERFLASAVAYAERERLDLLTCFLRNVRVQWPERILLPYSFALYFTGVSAARVNSAASKEALANGQCILFRREAYDAIGGHASVQTSVIEDVSLAAIAKQKRIRVRVVRAEHLGSVRMYDSLRAIWQGFNKNSFHFLRVNPWTGLQVVIASILLTSWLPALLLLAREGRWAPAVFFATLPMFFTAGWYGGLRASLSAPIAIYAFQAIALDGMFRAIFKRSVIWKGRHV